MKNKILKNNALFILVIACFCALAVAGTSYAFFFGVKSNTQNQIITAGDLKVTYTNSDPVNDTSLLPMSDEYALNNSNTGIYEQVFSIKNEGSFKSSYELNISTNDENTLDLGYIRVAIYKKNSSDEYVLVSGAKSLNEFTSKNANSYILTSGSLDVEDSEDQSEISYKIKVWLDINIPEEKIGENISLNINVESTVDENGELDKLIETE